MKKKLSIDPFPQAQPSAMRRARSEPVQDEARSKLMLSAIAVSSLVLVVGITLFRMDLSGSQQTEFAAPATPGAAQLQAPETAVASAPTAPAPQAAATLQPATVASLAPTATVRPPAARTVALPVQEAADQPKVDAPTQANPETAQIAQVAPQPVPQVQTTANSSDGRKPALAIVDEETGKVKELALDELQAVATLLRSPDAARQDMPLPANSGIARTQLPSDPNVRFSCVDALRIIAEQSTIFFRSGGTQLTPRAAARIRNIGAAMENCPEAIIQVSGHSDPSGDEQTNIAISWERADNTIMTLQSMGFDTSRMDPVGFGSRIPVAEGDNADQEDRRVEFQVMEKR